MNRPSPVSAPCSFLPWDTGFFGFRVGRVHARALTESSLPDILAWSAAEQIRCLYFLADPSSPETIRLAFTSGFQFVDIRLDLGCRLDPANPVTSAPGYIRTSRPDDLAPLQEIARVSHCDTRFFKDRGFPADKAAALYAEWIRRDLQAHTVFVVDFGDGQGPAGYVSCQVEPETRSGRIGLLAVAERFAGHGAGGALVRAALAWFGTQGCAEIRVATQASNVPAQRLYQAAGFRTVESAAWFHRWSPAAAPPQ